jgi:hypothetical protein
MILDLKTGVGDLHQLAGVLRVTLDDGSERRVRALVYSSGGVLRFGEARCSGPALIMQ